jgi:hypothetical protein
MKLYAKICVIHSQISKDIPRRLRIIPGIDREVVMSLNAEVEAAIDVLQRFAQQARDQQKLIAEEAARADSQLADIEALLREICRTRTELQVQMACPPFISPWI